MKRDIKKIMAIAMASSMIVMPLSVSAEKGTESAIKTTVVVNTDKTAQVEKTPGVEQKDEAIQAIAENEYLSFEGKVTSTDDNMITVKSGDALRIFHLSTMIISTKNGNVIAANEISVGDTVTALYTSDTPMALSNPPQINPLMIILQTEENNIKIDHFDNELLSADKNLKLVTSENTIIEAFKTKQIVKIEDAKDKDLVVIYGATTRSIPAQTVSAGLRKIIILPELKKSDSGKDTGNQNSGQSEDNKSNTATASAKNAIAKEARNMGYKVNWDSKSKVVVMTKGSDTIEIYVGTTRYKINGIEKRTDIANNIINGTTYVGNEIIDLLKK